MAAPPSLANDMNGITRLFACGLLVLASTSDAALNVIIIEGLGGEERYTTQFADQVTAVQAAAESLTSNDRVRAFRANDGSRDEIIAYFEGLASDVHSDDQVILYLIGHGSFDDHEYKFNLPGPDLTGDDIATSLAALPTENQVLINTSSASGAAIEIWNVANRVVITATRSGSERHATSFGRYFAAALSDPTADINKNNVISAQEAFDFAARGVTDYYDQNGQLATEHARIQGDRADRFSLARLGGAPARTDDSLLTELTAKRDAIAADIDALRLARGNMEQEDYQEQLLQRMLELATAEEAIERRAGELQRAQ
jgi:hypothetical protein